MEEDLTKVVEVDIEHTTHTILITSKLARRLRPQRQRRQGANNWMLCFVLSLIQVVVLVTMTMTITVTIPFTAVVVDGFINHNNHYQHTLTQHRRSRTRSQSRKGQFQSQLQRVEEESSHFFPSFQLRATTTTAETQPPTPTHDKNNNNNNDIDIVGENRRGDAKGAALRLEDVTVSRSGIPLLQNLNWRLEPKAKWALVGANGCGKSTLLKAILNDINGDNSASTDHLDIDGEITIGTKQQVGYLRQTAVSGSTLSVFEEASSAMKDITNARLKLQVAEEKVASYNDNNNNNNNNNNSSRNNNNNDSLLQNDLQIFENARQNYERVGGYLQESEVVTLLKGLGFTNMTQSCSELSGGWQMRVSFAKMLLSKPSLCLLDEPSNHLDRSARKWLATYLKKYDDGALLLVTHDIELLNTCDHIAEITGGDNDNGRRTLQVYKSCTYEQYMRQKRERAELAQIEYEKNIEKASKLQAFVDKWGASATKAKAAQSKVKQIEKMKIAGLLDEPSTAISEIERFKPRLVLPNPPPPQGRLSAGRGTSASVGHDVDADADDDNGILLALRNNAAIGYSATAAAATVTNNNNNNNDENENIVELISDIELEIQQGMKILIRGPNGAGKTTLLDTLRGTLPLLNGDRLCDSNLRLGIFTQDLAQELDTSRRAVDLVCEHARSGDDGNIYISDQDARNILGGLGLQGEKALRKIGQLSGGEKARVALAMFALKPSNLYLLDEVSNHLDIECVEALSEVLTDWGDGKGAIVVISHDKAFCEQVGFTHILTITDNGRLNLEQRDANDNDWDSSGTTYQKSTTAIYNGDTTTTNIGGGSSSNNNNNNHVAVIDKEVDAKRRKLAFNAPKRIMKIETLVLSKEEKISQLDEEMLANGSDVSKLVDLSRRKETLDEQVMELMEEWEELETIMAEMEGQ